MFSKTHIKGLGRVDRLTFILLSLVFSRLSQTSVSCYQHNTLNVPWGDKKYAVPVRFSICLEDYCSIVHFSYSCYISGPLSLFVSQRTISKKVIEYHWPPKYDMPCQPGNTSWTNIVWFWIWPVGVPCAIFVMDMQSFFSGFPQVLVIINSIDIVPKKLSWNIKLKIQDITYIVTGFDSSAT